jgi:hypothetical protein
MRRWFVVAATLMVAFSVLAAAGPAQASTSWPAKCKNMKCVNAHLNDLNKRAKAMKARVQQDEFVMANMLVCNGDALVNEMQGDPDQATGITGAVGPIGDTLGFDCNADFWPIFDPSLYTASPVNHAPANSHVVFSLRMLYRQMH